METETMRLFILSSIGSRIRDRRNEMGLSQEKLGEKVGTTQQTIAKIESTSPEASKYYALICEVLGVSFNFLMKGEKNISPADSRIDPEHVIELAGEALDQAMTSVKSIMLQRGQDPGLFDFDLMKEAFAISIRGKITGDYITATLSSRSNKKKA